MLSPKQAAQESNFQIGKSSFLQEELFDFFFPRLASARTTEEFFFFKKKTQKKQKTKETRMKTRKKDVKKTKKINEKSANEEKKDKHEKQRKTECSFQKKTNNPFWGVTVFRGKVTFFLDVSKNIVPMRMDDFFFAKISL